MADYIYQYSDGTTGSSPYVKGADGGIVEEGIYQGRAGAPSGPQATSLGMSSNGYVPSSGASGDYYSSAPQGGGAVFGGGARGGYGAGGMGSSTYGPNPYLADQANAIQAQSNQNLQQNIFPGIRSSALMDGSFGSSRQGIAEGVAAGNAATGVAAAQAGLYGSSYSTDQANQTARTGLANQYALGMGNLGLGYTNAGNAALGQNQSFYTQQRGLDLNQYQLGSSMYGAGITGQAGVGTGQYGTGQTYQQAPYTALQQYSNQLSPYTNLNSASQIQTPGAGVVNSALGGALAGTQISKNLGLSGYGGGANSTQNWTYAGAAPASNSWIPPSSASIEAGWS